MIRQFTRTLACTTNGNAQEQYARNQVLLTSLKPREGAVDMPVFKDALSEAMAHQSFLRLTGLEKAMKQVRQCCCSH